MSQSPPSDPAFDKPKAVFPLALALLCVVLVGAVGTTLGAWLLPGWLNADNLETARAGAIWGGVVATLCAAIAMIPMRWMSGRGLERVMIVWFGGTGFRMLGCIIGAVTLILVGGYPPQSTALTLMFVYLLALAAETVWFSRFLWRHDSTGGGLKPHTPATSATVQETGS
ncbi:MAG: hypothetical protein JJU36_12035 [Phycisphaeraceae bacterium]|nr:hypothetical protein [Phycisphaeraceae bacterium]